MDNNSNNNNSNNTHYLKFKEEGKKDHHSIPGLLHAIDEIN